jgi:hypothetical protein
MFMFMFMVGGPSPIDLFDPKPELKKRQGQPVPESFGRPVSLYELPSGRTAMGYPSQGSWVTYGHGGPANLMSC